LVVATSLSVQQGRRGMRDRDVLVSNTPGVLADATADLAMTDPDGDATRG
jgi:hypothetical protein